MTSFNMDGFGDYGNATSVTGTSTRIIGNAYSKQFGNKNTFQHGYSNTLTEGMVFTTSLAATFTTTVGLAATTVAGLAIATNLAFKVAVFVGAEASINVSGAVKVLGGGAFTFGKTEVWETAAQKIESDDKKTELAVKVMRVINNEINVYAEGLDLVAGGAVTESIGSRNITCLTSYTLTSPKVILNGPTSLTASTTGDLTLTSGTALKMLGGTATMSFFGVIKIG